MQLRFIRVSWFGLCLFAFALHLLAADTFSIGAYNVANYLDTPGGGSRPVKTPEGRAKVREMIRALDVDVLGLVEMGSRSALEELRTSLKKEGLDYPHWEHVAGYDTNIHVAVLSKFPISARRSHTKDSFLLNGRRFQVSRGFAEVDVQVNAGYTLTLLVAHLKSKRPVPEANEADWREQEAIILREKVDAIFARNANSNFALIGDLNDTKDSRPIRTVIGRSGAKQLFDTRPAERNGDTRIPPRKGYSPANISWTHFYGKEDTYSRIDYILLSQGMVKEWVEDETYVLAKSGWGDASDHRPIKATFHAKDK
jgi:endonuclease/exonuclease/phosphatase family metal-dependent hydrolase